MNISIEEKWYLQYLGKVGQNEILICKLFSKMNKFNKIKIYQNTCPIISHLPVKICNKNYEQEIVNILTKNNNHNDVLHLLYKKYT